MFQIFQVDYFMYFRYFKCSRYFRTPCVTGISCGPGIPGVFSGIPGRNPGIFQGIPGVQLPCVRPPTVNFGVAGIPEISGVPDFLVYQVLLLCNFDVLLH